MAAECSSWKCSDIAQSIATRVSFHRLCGLYTNEMSTHFDFLTGRLGKQTYING